MRIVHNRFVNFKRDPSDLLTTADKAVIKGFTYGKGTQKIQSYEGDAVFGWFNANQSAYPTSTVSKHLLFENVDLRHQIFTEEVNLDAFKDGDKNTAILDEDGTLSGFQVVDKDAKPLHDSRQFPISLNNLEFNRASNAVDECLSEGQQDTVAEKRPTSLMSPANMATLEFQYFKLNTVPLQDITFTKDSLDYGKHQFMTLTTGRNGQYLAEPKVASGFGYTITGMKGIPEVVHLGLTDAVKPDIIAPTSSTDPGKNPFFVRVGVCFTGPTINGKPTHPQDATKFTIDRGYKSWGGNGVNFADPDLKKFFVHLDPDHSYRGPEGDQIQHCLDLDVAHQDNLSDTTNGCPADGVTKVPDKGDCPFPSFKDKAGGPSGSTNEITACIYPATTLTQATTIADLKKGGLPDPTKYFYDPTTGWLFFYVVQEFPNPIAGSPLGSCSADGKGSNDDPACPDVKKNESFYACPAQGCVDYVVRLDDSTYKAASSDCGNPYPIGTTLYQQDPPANQNRLAYKGGANDGQMVKDCRDQASKLGFDHSVAGDGQKTTDGKETCVTTTRNPPSCPLTTP